MTTPRDWGLFVRVTGVARHLNEYNPLYTVFGEVRTKKQNMPTGLAGKPDLPCRGFVALSLTALSGPLEALACRFVQ